MHPLFWIITRAFPFKIGFPELSTLIPAFFSIHQGHGWSHFRTSSLKEPLQLRLQHLWSGSAVLKAAFQFRNKKIHKALDLGCKETERLYLPKIELQCSRHVVWHCYDGVSRIQEAPVSLLMWLMKVLWTKQQ